MHDTRAPVQLTGAVTVPIWPINVDGSCGCGSVRCRAAGKHPRPHGQTNHGRDGCGYGILTGAQGSRGSGIFVVDCDEQPGQSGLDAFAELCRMHGHDLPSTLIVATGGKWIEGRLRPGYHFYFRHPGFPIRSSVKELAPCVDVRGDPDTGFSIVVGPGSPHSSGNPYRVVHEAPIADAPGWLLDWPGLRKTAIDLAALSALESNPFAFAPTPIDPTTPEGQRRISAYTAECQGVTGELAPAIEGAGGSDRMYHACARGLLHWVLPHDTVRDIVSTHYNARCVPSWNEKEIAHKLFSVLSKNRDICPGPTPEGWGGALVRAALVGAESAANDGTQIGARKHNEAHAYSMTLGDVASNGKLSTRSISAITYQLRRHPDWIGVLQYDDFSESIRAVDPPIPLDAETGPLTESDVTAIRVWFECTQDTQVSNETLWACVTAVARACRVHCVRDYLANLPPGNPGMLDDLATRWFGAKEPLDNEMLKRFLVGAVRRALMPGTKMDTMLVLYGDQGHKKSQWIGALFSGKWDCAPIVTRHRGPQSRAEVKAKARGYWHSEQMPDLSKGADSSVSIATVWGQEFPELDKLLRADPSTAKDFLSRVVDKYRPAYGRSFITKARQAVFIGTTNEREFLRDPTGERRYWIIEVASKIDIELVASERDAVWAAALALAMRADVAHWFETGDQWDTLLKARQEAYAKGDGWTDTIADFLAGRDVVTVAQLAEHCVFRGDLGWMGKLTPTVRDRLIAVCRKLGGRATGSTIVVPEHLRTRPVGDAERTRRALLGGAASGPAFLTLVKGGAQ